MPITLGLNISSLKAQQQLTKSSDSLSKVFERLSSGQRINRASDDAAGLAIADSLNADARVYTQGIRNLNDGLSALTIADGALSQLSNITTRLVELAEQSANGVFSNTQRAALNEEAQSLKAEFSRIIQSTKFNGRQILTSEYGELQLQAGYGTDGAITSTLGGAVGNGTFASELVYDVGLNPSDVTSGDFNGDGFRDLAVAERDSDDLRILLGNGNGSFTSSSTVTTPTGPTTVIAKDFNNDGILDLASADYLSDSISVFLGNGDGSFQTAVSTSVGNEPNDLVAGDFNGDGILDLAAPNRSDDTISILLGNGDGSFSSAGTLAGLSLTYRAAAGDFNGDGILDLVSAEYTGDSVRVYMGNGDGSFDSGVDYAAGNGTSDVQAQDLNGDGILDLATTNFLDNTVSILIGNSDGTFQAQQTYATGAFPYTVRTGDLNGDGYADIVNSNAVAGTIGVLLGDGTGAFEEAQYFSVGTGPFGVILDDFSGDGVLDIVAGNSVDDTISVLLGNTTSGTAPLLDFSLQTQADALQALPMLSDKLDQLSAQRGEIGAFQSRIQVADNVLSVTTENYKSAESRIRDADIAQESANLVRLNILQQAASAVLAQANQQPQLTLQLLGGGR